MVFKRKLSKDEILIIERIVDFVKDKHIGSEGHDYSHVLEVCKLSIELSRKVRDPIDPFILIAGALLHDIGRVGTTSGRFHGIDGSTRAAALLESLVEDHYIIEKIQKVIVRHSPESMIMPESPEEKVVFDADTIERLGFMGMVRGIMGKKGSMEFIIEDRIHKRLADYDKLFYKESRKMASKAHKETIAVSKTLKEDLRQRAREIHEITSYKLIKEE